MRGKISPARLSENLKRLTEKGRLFQEAADSVHAAEYELGCCRLSAKAWNMPVLLALHFNYEHFQDIRPGLDE
ncbi:hypothetical protein [Paenibacillus agaridevorans]|uniref:hypothetical protein n=1 Tax=Paenibacillus agaridevorans TaxID=171404 RepID=UPI001BE3D62D|nr:hypothetical protein [Paenibacillus agaridevorans]